MPRALSLRDRFRNPILIVLIAAMLSNLALALYIQAQKEQNLELIPEALRGKCFDDAIGGGGCGAVQTSEYATTLGMSNPHIGYVGFSSLAILLIGLVYVSARQQHLAPGISAVILSGMMLASIFSLYLLYAQFFRIHYTCVYCLAVDYIVLASTAAFTWLSWPTLNLKRL